MPECQSKVTIMGGRACGKTLPEEPFARRGRNFTVDEPRDIHRIDHGPAHSKTLHPEAEGRQRPTRRARSYTDAETHVQSRSRTHHHRDDKQCQPEPPQKMGFLQRVKVAKDAIKETIQVGRETVGFIRELHKQYKELEQESTTRPRPRPRSQAWHPAKRRSSCEYDSD